MYVLCRIALTETPYNGFDTATATECSRYSLFMERIRKSMQFIAASVARGQDPWGDDEPLEDLVNSSIDTINEAYAYVYPDRKQPFIDESDD